MITQPFDASTELDEIRELKKFMCKKTYHKSRLAKYRAELVTLRQSGASYAEITLWLRKKKRMKVCHTTVMRYLSKLPELNHA
jgi:hypothetical protein